MMRTVSDLRGPIAAGVFATSLILCSHVTPVVGTATAEPEASGSAAAASDPWPRDLGVSSPRALVEMALLGPEGQRVGEVIDIVAPKDTDRIYAVVLLHDLIEPGCKAITVPVDAMSLGPEGEAVVTELSRQKLASMPAYEPSRWRSVVLPGSAYVMPPQTFPASRGDGGAGRDIKETVYEFIQEPGSEQEGYGLYSYALFPHHDPRVEAFLQDLFKETGWAGDSLIAPEKLNSMYLPVSREVDAAAGEPGALAERVANELYHYPQARAMLAKICDRPAESLEALCSTDLSRGPYLFTYAAPASGQSRLPPPYLFVDLSNVHKRAFPRFIAEYKAQVKRPDFTDRERIDTFRMGLLNITLTAADWVQPVVGGVTAIVRLVAGGSNSSG